MLFRNNSLKEKMLYVRIIVFGLITIWTIFLSGFFYYNYRGFKNWNLKLAETEAWASFNKDVIYRKWAASHGGLYVPPTEKTPPSPYLSHIPDRDIISTKGKKLTLVNPAYMTRQVHDLGKDRYDVKGHITSLNPIRPGNEPDSWEEMSLKMFNDGAMKNVGMDTNQIGKKVLRAMKPLKVEKGCLKCHEYQGYKIGDIRGGLSVEVSMDKYNKHLIEQIKSEAIIFIIIWLVGVLAIIVIAVFYVKNLNTVTENNKRQEALEKQLQQSQKMEAVGQLAGGIAHDFNNLLGIIIGFTELGMDDVEDQTSILRYFENIGKTAERAKELVSQISIFSRQKEMSKELIDLNMSIKEFLVLLKRTIGEHIKVSFKKGVDPLKFIGDKTQFEQVIMNLCVNARDAMNDGGTIAIETDYKKIDNEFCISHPWAKPGNYAVIKISDTGIGIEKNTLDRIFDPFFTTKEVGKGTGLGLSVVFGIIKKHDGLINVYSVPNYGTIFSIYFPIADEKNSGVTSEGKDETVNNYKYDGTILLAEDEELLRDMISNILSSAGYKLLIAENGEQAIKLFKENSNRIDLLLFDVMMPVMGGLKAYHEISNIKMSVPVLFASGYSSETISSEILNTSDYEIIWKPFSREELLNKIGEVIDKEKNKGA